MRCRTVLVLITSLVTTVIAAGEQVPSPMPPISELAYRIDPATGTLTPLEQAREKGQERTGWSEYRYLEGPQSSVSLPGDQPLQFVIRVDGSTRTLKDRHIVCHFLEELGPAKDRRYRTKKAAVRLEQEFSEIVVPGLNPKKPKDGTLRISLRAPNPLPPGEYAVVLQTCSHDWPGPGPQYGAFRVVASR
jgi:hypothetical protein